MSATELNRFWSQARALSLLLAVGRGVLRAIPVALGAMIVLAGFHAWLEVPLWGRRVLWILAAAATTGATVSGFFPLSLFSARGMSRSLGERSRSTATFRSDDLHLALQLATAPERPGRSSELAQAFVAAFEGRLRSVRPWWCFPRFDWGRQAGLAVAACALAALLSALFPSHLSMNRRLLFPFGFSDLEGLIRIAPRDADVAWGEDAFVEVTVLRPEAGRPVLSVRTADAWLAIQPESESGRALRYRIRNVVQPVAYRVGIKNDWTRRFTLTPRPPVRINSFSIELTPPGYTQRAPVRQTSPELAGLPGTLVSMEARSNTELSAARIVFADGRERAATVDGDLLKLGFPLEKPGEYTLELTPPSGAVTRVSYPIRIQEDAPPTMSLLSPEQDLIVGENEKLPLTYDARDDVGVAEVRLHWQRGNGATRSATIRRFSPAAENALYTHDWDLARAGFRAGEVIRYQVEAVDGNVVTGPGRATSAWRVVEIASFEQEHAALEDGLEQWREKALEVLARSTTLDAEVRKGAETPEALAPKFSPVAHGMQQLEQGLSRLVSRMEQDPLADYGVWLEHKAMLDSLSAMNKSAVPGVQAALQTGNKDAAAEGLQQMSSEIERMTALSENLAKTQNARDVMEAGERLEEIGRDLEQALSSGAPESEIERQVRDLIQEAQKNLQEMARSLQQMPQDLPEDFVNQQAIKELDLGKSQDLLSQIQQALQRGDTQAALQMAKSFLAATQTMREQLGKAHESFLQSNSASDLAQKMEERKKELDRIVEEQRGLLAETQKLESKRLERVLEQQKELLGALAERQRAVARRAGEWVGLPGFPTGAGSLARAQIRPMQEVAVELESRKVDRSLEFLAVIIAHLGNISSDLARSSATAVLAGIGEELRTEEAAILKELSSPEDSVSLGPEDASALGALKGRQQDLGRRTDGLKQELQKLSRKTASLGVPLTQGLSKASGAMEKAGQSLGDGDSRSAQRSEETALNHLRESQSALEQAQNAMQEMSMQQGGPGSGSGGGSQQIIARPGGGRQGTQTGKVRLPSADEYRPPKAFREDLLESLKENYPKIYEDIIHKYYKRLAD